MIRFWSSYVIDFILGVIAGTTFISNTDAIFSGYIFILVIVIWVYRLYFHCQTMWACALAGLFWGLGLYGVGQYFVFTTFTTGAGWPAWQAALVWLFLVFYFSCLPALFGLIYWKTKKFPRIYQYLCLSFVWSGIEFLRYFYVFGYPLNGIAQTQINTPLLGFAALGGEILLSCIIFLIASNFSFAIRLILIKRNLFTGLIYVFLNIFIFILGYLILNYPLTQEDGNPVRLALYQSNEPVQDRWQSNASTASFKKLESVLEKLNVEYDALILPENFIAYPWHKIPFLELSKTLKNWSNSGNASLILGAYTADTDNTSQVRQSILIVPESLRTSAIQVPYSALFWSTEAKHYDKHILIPWAEKIPTWMNHLGIRFLSMSNGIQGDGSSKSWKLKDQTFAPSLCFELMFGSFIRDSAKDASVLLNLGHLGWFADTLLPLQMDKVIRLRAAELGKPLVHVDGYVGTMLVNPDGSIAKQISPAQPNLLTVEVQGRKKNTPYGAFGHGIWLLLFVFVFFGYFTCPKPSALSGCGSSRP